MRTKAKQDNAIRVVTKSGVRVTAPLNRSWSCKGMGIGKRIAEIVSHSQTFGK